MNGPGTEVVDPSSGKGLSVKWSFPSDFVVLCWDGRLIGPETETGGTVSACAPFDPEKSL